jgi:hypothetical protein
MAYSKQSHYNNVSNRCMEAKIKCMEEQTKEDFDDEDFDDEDIFDSYPEGKQDKAFVDKHVKKAIEELEKSFKIMLEAAKDQTIKDLDWWNSKDRNLDELIYECFKLARTYRPDDGAEIVDEIFDRYGVDTAVCRSIRRHLVEGTPFIVEEEEE